MYATSYCPNFGQSLRRLAEPGMVCPGLYAGPLLRADRNWDSEVGQGKRKSGAAAAAVGGSTGSSSRHQEKQQKAAGACRVFFARRFEVAFSVDGVDGRCGDGDAIRRLQLRLTGVG